MTADDVTDAMVDAAFGDLLDGTGNANWASRPNREVMRGALARAINASGCVLPPRDAAPLAAIGRILCECMDQAIANGANSISMPDEYVQVAVWLAAMQEPKP